MQQTITFLEDDATSRVIGVDDIRFAAPAMTILPAVPVAPESDDDDVPIAANLETKLKKTKTKRKKVKQQRWDYVQVAEPTGVASNYWDAAAPVERATKRVAKQKIKEIQDGELTAPLLPDGNSVSVVPEVVDVARKDKTKRTGKQRRSDLQAFMANLDRVDEASNRLSDDALASPTGSDMPTHEGSCKPKVYISFSKCTKESRYYNCFLYFFEH